MRCGRFCSSRGFVSLQVILIVLSFSRGVVCEAFCSPEEVAFDQGAGIGGLSITQMAPAVATQKATFGAGCFWSVELAFQRVPGVTKTAVGYTQGSSENPSYQEVCSGRTGHVEAVLVDYNPGEVSYEQLLDVFWKKHDPTQLNRQGNDVGSQYRSGIYFHTQEQEAAALASVKGMEAKLGKKVATEVLPAKTFYPAEEYHQQYLEKGGRGGGKQSARKGCNDPIRCYG